MSYLEQVYISNVALSHVECGQFTRSDVDKNFSWFGGRRVFVACQQAVGVNEPPVQPFSVALPQEPRGEGCLAGTFRILFDYKLWYTREIKLHI